MTLTQPQHHTMEAVTSINEVRPDKHHVALTVCRQHQHETGRETYRQLCTCYARPIGTRSVGYLTKLQSPTFDPFAKRL